LILGTFEVNVSGFAIVEGKMRTFIVVEPDSFANGGVCMLPVKKEAIKALLDLEDAVDGEPAGPGQGVLVTVADLARAGTDAGILESFTIGRRGVLNAMVRMMDHAYERYDGRLLQRHVKGAKAAFHGQRGRQIIADNEAGKGIRKQGQIGKTGLGGDIGDIADPHLLNATETLFSQLIGEYPQSAAGRTSQATFVRHQEVMLSQDVKEGVSTSGDVEELHLRPQLME
jgi:hypothetical protein